VACGASGLVKRGAHLRQIAKQQATLEQDYRKLVPILESCVSSDKRMAALVAHWVERFADPDPWFGNEELRRRNLAISLYNVRRAEWQIEVYVRRLGHYWAIADHHASLRKKYEHAATHPWEKVPQDPPKPPAPADPPEPKLAPADPPADQKHQLPPDRFLTMFARALDPCLRS
jgi:hypothetical protein